MDEERGAATIARVRRALPSFTAALLLASGGSGCVNLNDFDPVGDDATISGSWTIDGAPPTTASCDDLGANRVQVTFLDDRRPVPHAALFFSCSAMQPDATVAGTFDTRGSMGGLGPVVEGGTPEDPASWAIRLDAIDGSGNIVVAGPVTFVDVVGAVDAGAVGDAGAGFVTTHIALPEAAFFTSTMSAFFDVAGQPVSTAACDSIGVDQVRLVFEGMSDLDVTEPCEAGSVGRRVAPGMDYVIHLEALDASGAVVGVSAPERFMVRPGDHCILTGGECEEGIPNGPYVDLAAL